MGRLPFPRFYGCLLCLAYITATGEVHAAACSLATYLDHLETHPEIEGVGRVAGAKRSDIAADREARARLAFERHECEHKHEQAEWAEIIRSRPVLGRYKE